MEPKAASLSQPQFALSFMRERTAPSGLKPDDSELSYRDRKYFCKESINRSLRVLIKGIGNLVFHLGKEAELPFPDIPLSSPPAALHRARGPRHFLSHGPGV